MKSVSFSKAVELFTGKIGLTDAQAKKRMRYLKPVKKGVYEITGKIEFKAGESIKLENIPKGLFPVAPAAPAAVETPEAEPVLDQPTDKQIEERDFNDPDSAEVIKTKKRG